MKKTYTAEELGQYQVSTGKKVVDLDRDELLQEVCRLIDHLEEYASDVYDLSLLEDKWRHP